MMPMLSETVSTMQDFMISTTSRASCSEHSSLNSSLALTNQEAILFCVHQSESIIIHQSESIIIHQSESIIIHQSESIIIHQSEASTDLCWPMRI